MPGLPGSPECMWLLTLKFPTNVFRLWKKMDNRNKFGFWFPGCCRLGFVKLDFGSRGVLHNCQLLKCNFLSENNAASSFLIRKRKIKYKWHHPPYTDEKPFCGSFNGKNSTLFPLIRNLLLSGDWDPAGSWLCRLACQQVLHTQVSSFSYIFGWVLKTYHK